MLSVNIMMYDIKSTTSLHILFLIISYYSFIYYLLFVLYLSILYQIYSHFFNSRKVYYYAYHSLTIVFPWNTNRSLIEKYERGIIWWLEIHKKKTYSVELALCSAEIKR